MKTPLTFLLSLTFLFLFSGSVYGDDFDYGYDAECGEINNNDLNLNFEGKNMNIQAYSPMTDDKVIPS